MLMTMVFKGDAAALRARSPRTTPTRCAATVDHAVEHGLIAHRFYASDDGQMMVVDEWPDAESFQHFFDAYGRPDRADMQASGVTEEPATSVLAGRWRRETSKAGTRRTRHSGPSRQPRSHGPGDGVGHLIPRKLSTES